LVGQKDDLLLVFGSILLNMRQFVLLVLYISDYLTKNRQTVEYGRWSTTLLWWT